jgi:hypothetical protein
MDPFRFRDCGCPSKPHDGKDGRDDGDYVTFRSRLSFPSGIEALRLILDTPGDETSHAVNALPVYLRDGPESWNLLDGDGKPLPLTKENVEALPFADQYEIGDHGDDLYGGEVLAPLLRRMSKSSGNGQTGGSSRRRPTRSSTTPS